MCVGVFSEFVYVGVFAFLVGVFTVYKGSVGRCGDAGCQATPLVYPEPDR